MSNCSYIHRVSGISPYFTGISVLNASRRAFASGLTRIADLTRLTSRGLRTRFTYNLRFFFRGFLRARFFSGARARRKTQLSSALLRRRRHVRKRPVHKDVAFVAVDDASIFFERPANRPLRRQPPRFELVIPDAQVIQRHQVSA